MSNNAMIFFTSRSAEVFRVPALTFKQLRCVHEQGQIKKELFVEDTDSTVTRLESDKTDSMFVSSADN